MSRAARLRRPRLLSFAALLLALSLAAAATQWRMQPKDSKLSFVATQAGAPFEGAFRNFTADIRFDPQDLAASRFDVSIDMTSVDTNDGERDGIIKGPDLFAVQQWPQAHYVAEHFSTAGKGKYTANGKLTMRGITREVPVQFTFEKNDAGARLQGAASLRRLDFGVGQGEWRDTSAVANEVQVRFSLLLQG